jgi:hypothetical protein
LNIQGLAKTFTPFAGHLLTAKKWLLSEDSTRILEEIADNRYTTAIKVLERARFANKSGQDAEIRIARGEFVGAYVACEKQTRGISAWIKRTFIPILSATYMKMCEAAMFMALCDKALGEPAMLKMDVEKAQSAFENYQSNLLGPSPEASHFNPKLEQEFNEERKGEAEVFQKLCTLLLQ